MNAFDRELHAPATVHYGDGEYVVLKPGRYVVCAVSGEAIPLEGLRYWNAAEQEPYASAPYATQRWLTLLPK